MLERNDKNDGALPSNQENRELADCRLSNIPQRATRRELKARKECTDVLAAHLLDQETPGRRFLEITDKVVRIISEYEGQLSQAVFDRRIISLFDTKEFLSDRKLQYPEREYIIASVVKDLYPLFRARFRSDYSGHSIEEILDRSLRKPQLRKQPKNQNQDLELHEPDGVNVATSEGEPLVVTHVSEERASTEGKIETQELPVSTVESQAPALENTAFVGSVTLEQVVVEEKPTIAPSASEELQKRETRIEPKLEKIKKPIPLVSRVEEPRGVSTPFRSKLLEVQLLSLALPVQTIRALEIDGQPRSALDFLNLSQQELQKLPRLNDMQLAELRRALGSVHPAFTVLTSPLNVLPINFERRKQLQAIEVYRTVVREGKYLGDPSSSKVPIDNGWRVLRLTAELLKKLQLSAEEMKVIRERFYAVGFPRPER